MASVMRKHPSESDIKRQICEFLSLNKILHWTVYNGGIYDRASGGYRRLTGSYRKGVSDLLGIYKQRPLAIEVKSKYGVLSPFQQQFLLEFAEAGGIAIVAKSVEDVEGGLKSAFVT